jgi:hypothetical protein
VNDLLHDFPSWRSVFSHLRHHQLLVERAALTRDATAVVLDGDAADRRELLVAALAGADIARIDAMLSRAAPRGMARQQMSVVVKIADGGALQPASSIRCLISGRRARPRACSP